MSVCLIVIDGWGISENPQGNAIHHARTPVMDELCAGEFCSLNASGLSVGLPDGLMGNSEVGHMNIGAGRVIYQDIVRINMDIKSKAIHNNHFFLEACNRAKEGNGRLHLLGLVSDGGVHSHIEHLFCLLEGAKVNGVPKTFIQFFGDGRDTSPTIGANFAQNVLEKISELGYGSLSTVTGRYYAMDRDKRWERIQIAYEGMVQGLGEECTPERLVGLIRSRYDAPEEQRQTDEFLKPIVLDRSGFITDDDTLVFFNFRADRMRQIVETFGLQRNFETSLVPINLGIYTMTEYKKEFPFTVLYPPSVPRNVLSEWLAAKALPQFHCAETEKYAHVTFFFNGGQEKAFPMEDRVMVPSPKVATYDLQPEMNCAEVGQEMVKAIESKKYPFVMCNFAPPDMVGHTGKYEPAVLACEATDSAIGAVAEACARTGTVLLVTADHGNAEKMLDDKGGPHTAHTTYRVPLCMKSNTGRKFREITHDAALCDVAPTVLDLLGVEKPPEMMGQSLLTPL